MKRVTIISPTGMVGSMVYNILKDHYKLVLVYRDESKLRLLNKTYGKVKNHKRILFDLSDIYKDYSEGFPTSSIGKNTERLIKTIGQVDAIINCAGIIKQYCLTKSREVTVFINAILPHILNAIYKEKLIHISTDCVFNGISGAPYDEKSPKTPNDLYGLTKSLGEPSENSLVLRTSYVGPEIANFVSLLEWFKKQEGKTIQGFTNHIWNGITTKQFAIICDRIIRNRQSFPPNGLFHIFSTPVTKYEMLSKFKEKFKVNVTIKPSKAVPIDRRLTTVYGLCKNLKIPSFEQMLEEL